MEPEEVMMMLHQLYTKYDALCNTHGVYKGTAGACEGESYSRYRAAVP